MQQRRAVAGQRQLTPASDYGSVAVPTMHRLHSKTIFIERAFQADLHRDLHLSFHTYGSSPPALPPKIASHLNLSRDTLSLDPLCIVREG